MTGDDLFAAVAVAVVLTGLGIAVAMFRKSGQTRFDRLAPAFEFGTCRKIGPWGTTIAGLYRGFHCRYVIQPASQNNPGGASIRVAVAGASPWSAEVTSAGARFMAKIGILRDLEIGIPDLDRSFRFSAEDQHDLRSLFDAGDVRESFNRIRESENFAGVRITTDRFEVRWAPRSSKLDENVEVLRQRLEMVMGLITACRYPPSEGV